MCEFSITTIDFVISDYSIKIVIADSSEKQIYNFRIFVIHVTYLKYIFKEQLK